MAPVTYNAGEDAFIDHELSVHLDSTEAFEGPEKLLEVWFYNHDQELPDHKSLRSISHTQWADILDLVNCKILSIKSSSKLDAFLLSESSLFVYDHKLVLKTCGTTTTLLCLDALFQLVQRELGWDFMINGKQPAKVFYSRRAFMFPEKQRSVHRNWQDEVDYLNQFFTHGSHYLIGRIDNSHWHLYTTTGQSTAASASVGKSSVDETFEILMTEISADRALQFVTSRKPGFEIDDEHDLGHFLGQSTSNNTGLNNLYNTVQVHDAFSFTPCGYSSNSILDEDKYYTLHVTPEKDWSYASFESNVDAAKFNLTNVDILYKVLSVFRPHKFQFTFFSNMESESMKLLRKLDSLKGYQKMDKILYDLDDYQLLYVSFQLCEEEMISRLTIH